MGDVEIVIWNEICCRMNQQEVRFIQFLFFT